MHGMNHDEKILIQIIIKIVLKQNHNFKYNLKYKVNKLNRLIILF